MSGYKNFAVIGAGEIRSFIIRQLITDQATGNINNVIVLTRQGSKTTVDPATKLIPFDYSNKESIKKALTGVDVVISTISWTALDLQPRIAEAAKEIAVKLFVPSEFGGPTEGEIGGLVSTKAGIREQLEVIGIPYALFYTGGFMDYLWVPAYGLDITNGKVTVGGDGSTPMPFTSRPDINRSFTVAGDIKRMC